MDGFNCMTRKGGYEGRKVVRLEWYDGGRLS